VGLSSRAVATAVVAAAVAVAAFFGLLPLTLASAALAVLVAIGWPSLLNQPAPGGSGLVIGLTGVGAVAAVAATEGEPSLRNLPLVLAMGIVLAFVAEMLRRDGRPRLVESLLGTVSGLVVAVSAAGWIATDRTDAGAALVVTCAATLAVASAVSALPVPGWWNTLLTLAASIAAGGALAWALPEVVTVNGLWTGAVSGMLVAALHALFDQLPALERRAAALAAIVLPVTVGGILVFVVGRVLVG
jgi:hypothetical protein